MLECFFLSLLLFQCCFFTFFFLLALQFPLLRTLLSFLQFTLTLKFTLLLICTKFFQLFKGFGFLRFGAQVTRLLFFKWLLPAETALLSYLDRHSLASTTRTRATSNLEFAHRAALECNFSG